MQCVTYFVQTVFFGLLQITLVVKRIGLEKVTNFVALFFEIAVT